MVWIGFGLGIVLGGLIGWTYGAIWAHRATRWCERCREDVRYCGRCQKRSVIE